MSELESLKIEWERTQNNLKSSLIISDSELSFSNTTPFNGLKYIAGVDISFILPDDISINSEINQGHGNEENAVACISVIEFPSLKTVYVDFATITLEIPYIPTFLAFRETPPLLSLLSKLRSERPEIYPQVIFVDGNGRLHPRQFGLACHLGVLADVPTIGVSKNFLAFAELDKHITANYINVADLQATNAPDESFDSTHGPSIVKKVKHICRNVLKRKGDTWDIKGDDGQVYGVALLPTENIKNPIFVSVGHRISLSTAVALTLAVSRYRIPEPIRVADKQSRAVIRQLSTE
ncbi:endonuclease V [Paraphysoderma sedebokerense]|nr:endonuclease V [Paraphysoderma sedebokerense]